MCVCVCVCVCVCLRRGVGSPISQRVHLLTVAPTLCAVGVQNMRESIEGILQKKGNARMDLERKIMKVMMRSST